MSSGSEMLDSVRTRKTRVDRALLGVLQADMFSISDRFLDTTGTGNVYARQLITIIMTVLKVCFSAKLHVKV